jgi:hypothetical protein
LKISRSKQNFRRPNKLDSGGLRQEQEKGVNHTGCGGALCRAPEFTDMNRLRERAATSKEFAPFFADPLRRLLDCLISRLPRRKRRIILRGIMRLAFGTIVMLCTRLFAAEGPELVRNGSFESQFQGWTRWGRNSDLITIEKGGAHSGDHCARIRPGKNALYFQASLKPGQAYEIRFFHRIEGVSGHLAVGFVKQGGALRSAGGCRYSFRPTGEKRDGWIEFREAFLTTSETFLAQFAFTAGDRSVLFLDDISLRAVPRPVGLKAPPLPWEGLSRRTRNPLFAELLGTGPGGYTVTCWTHDLNPRGKQGFKAPELEDATVREQEVLATLREAGEAGMGFMDLPGGVDGKEP